MDGGVKRLWRWRRGLLGPRIAILANMAPSHSLCDSEEQERPGEDAKQPFLAERVWQLTAHLPVLDPHSSCELRPLVLCASAASPVSGFPNSP